MLKTPRIGLVLLAAGGSSRMGDAGPKQLLPIGDRSMLRRAAEVALESRCRPVIVVLGAHAERCRGELVNLPVTIVENPRWPDGMGSSISTGIAALDHRDIDGVVLMLCDQPGVTADLLNALIDVMVDSAHPIVASQYGGTLGVPALFSRDLIPELSQLTGPRGAKQLIAQRGGAVGSVPFPQGNIDIDTAADYARPLDPPGRSG